MTAKERNLGRKGELSGVFLVFLVFLVFIFVFLTLTKCTLKGYCLVLLIVCIQLVEIVIMTPK